MHNLKEYVTFEKLLVITGWSLYDIFCPGGTKVR